MKTTKITITVCAVILGMGLLLAQKPTDKGKNNELIELIVEKLNADVQLTDSQKTAIREYTITFIGKMESSHLKTNEKERFTSKEQASLEYELMLENILTNDQKEQRNTKMKEREDKNSKQTK